MLEAACDLGFEQEAIAAVGIVGIVELNFLQGNVAVQFVVARDVNLPQAAGGVRAENAEAGFFDGGGIDRQRGVGVGIGGRPCGRNVNQAGLNIRVAQFFQVITELTDAGKRGEAPFGVAIVLLEVLANECFQELTLIVGQCSPLAKNLIERAAFVGEPDADGGDQIAVRDEVVLEGKEAEEQIAINVAGGHLEFPDRQRAECRSR